MPPNERERGRRVGTCHSEQGTPEGSAPILSPCVPCSPPELLPGPTREAACLPPDRWTHGKLGVWAPLKNLKSHSFISPENSVPCLSPESGAPQEPWWNRKGHPQLHTVPQLPAFCSRIITFKVITARQSWAWYAPSFLLLLLREPSTSELPMAGPSSQHFHGPAYRRLPAPQSHLQNAVAPLDSSAPHCPFQNERLYLKPYVPAALLVCEHAVVTSYTSSQTWAPSP